MDKGQIVQIRIEDMTDDGKGIGRADGLAVFADGAVPGDRVKAEITKCKKRYAEARVTEITEPSPDRREPDCPYFGKCGGCSMLNLEYDAQLRIKKHQVEGKLKRIGHIDDPKIAEVVPSEPLHYRNKMEYAVSPDGKIGFYMKRSSRIVDCRSCLLQNEAAAAAAECLRGFIQNGVIHPFDPRRGRGLLRSFTVRTCEGSGEVMIIIYINGKSLPDAEKIVYALEDAVDACDGYSLQSVVAATQRGKSRHAEVTDYNVIAGKRTITDYADFSDNGIFDTDRKLKFEISAPAFYQVNTKQMKKLYAVAAEMADLTGEELLLDVYCGIGTIGLMLADRAEYVVGIESVHGAVVDANRNAVINGIVNARYHEGLAEEKLPKLLERLSSGEKDEEDIFLPAGLGDAPRVAVIDPPRAGCDEKLLDCLVDLGTDRIVYVSCDPGTMARDIAYLREKGYEFVRAVPVDMFPETSGIETVCLINRRR